MELPQGVIIIAIIVLVVLVVVLAFFTGGFGTIGERLRGLFSGSVDDQATAVNFCNSYCDSAKNFDSANTVTSSAFCTKWFKLDKDNDGKVDKNKEKGKTIRYYCDGSNNGAFSSGVQLSKDEVDDTGIGVPCPDLKFTCQGTPAV